jgi:hypothetical protein
MINKRTPQCDDSLTPQTPMVDTQLSSVATASFSTADFSDYEAEPLSMPSTSISSYITTPSFSPFNLDHTSPPNLSTGFEASNASHQQSASTSFNMNPAATPTQPLSFDQELSFTSSWWNNDALLPNDLLPTLSTELLPFPSTILDPESWITDTTWTAAYSTELSTSTTHQPARRTSESSSPAGGETISGYSADSEEDETYGSSDEVDSDFIDWGK